MRAVPRFRRLVIAQALTIGMADDRRALRARRPILAGLVVTRGKCAAVGLRNREDVVPVRRVAAAVDDLALLAERGLLGEVVGRPVQVGNVLGDHSALGVLPRSLADAVARGDGWLAVGGLRGEISAPGLAAGPAGLGQLLALRIGPLQATEIGAFTRTVGGHEERHVGRLRLCRWRR